MTFYRVIVPHPTRRRVLLLQRGPRLALPRVRHAGGWVAYAVHDIARRTSRRTGLRLTFLRELSHGGLQALEMENHSRADQLAPGARWVSADELDDAPLADEAQRRLLREWFAEGGAGRVSRRRARWECAGWLAKAAGWIGRRLDELGFVQRGPLVQFKSAWSWSCILQVPTDAGALYFKAGYAKPPGESQVIGMLAESWPGSVPTILASDSRRRWTLMTDFGGRPLDALPEQHWAEAVTHFAALQIGSARQVERLTPLGCPVRTPEQLLASYRRILSKPSAFAACAAEQDAAVDVPALRRQTDKFARWCSELSAHTIPAAVVNEDFRLYNVVAVNRNYLFFDWTDTVIAHPFFSMARFLDFVPSPDGAGRGAQGRLAQLLRDAYLEPWTAYEPARRLRAAFTLVQKLNPLYLAVRWHFETQFLEPASLWARRNAEMVKSALRRCAEA